MSRISYVNNCWVDTKGPRPEIKLKPLTNDDYYYFVQDCELIIQIFSGSLNFGDAIGNIYHATGERVDQVVPMPHLDAKVVKYPIEFGWVQDKVDNTVSLIFHARLISFRVWFDFKSLSYSKPESLL